MPLYDYTCHSCGDTIEAIQPHTAPSTMPCHCGGSAHRATIYRVSVPTGQGIPRWDDYGGGDFINGEGTR